MSRVGAASASRLIVLFINRRLHRSVGNFAMLPSFIVNIRLIPESFFSRNSLYRSRRCIREGKAIPLFQRGIKRNTVFLVPAALFYIFKIDRIAKPILPLLFCGCDTVG